MQFHEHHGPAVGRESVSKFKPQITQIVTDDSAVVACGFLSVSICEICGRESVSKFKPQITQIVTDDRAVVASGLWLLICVHL
jgi:hypothetical protein